MNKMIEVDWNNISDLSKTISMLQKRRKSLLEAVGSKPLTFALSKYNVEHIIPVLQEMLNFPYSYEENNFKNFYVYFHCNPLKPLNVKSNIKHLFLATNFGLNYQPFYVGKGTGNRANDLNRNDSHRKMRSEIRKNNKEIIVHIGKNNLSEAEALHIEGVLFDILGLITNSSSGFLVNLDEGTKDERIQTYRNSPNSKKIMKILSLNKTYIPKLSQKNKEDNNHIQVSIEDMDTNLNMLKELVDKYPSSSADFIASKAKYEFHRINNGLIHTLTQEK